MTWTERLSGLFYLMVSAWVGYRSGEQGAILLLALGAFLGHWFVVEEFRREVRSVKVLLQSGKSELS